MAKKRKKRPKYKGEEVPRGISKVKGANGSVYFYVGAKKDYAGEGAEGFSNAKAMRIAYEMGKDRDRKYATGQHGEAKRIDREIASRLSLKDLCKWYMNLATIKQQDSYERKVYSVGHLLRHIGEKPITALDEVQEDYRTDRAGEGASEATINQEISTLSAVLHKAAKKKKIPKDSLPGEFVMVKNPSAPRRIVTEEEYSKLLEAAEADQDFQDFMVCAHETGMRNTEICELTVEQVHLDKVWSEVPYEVVHYIYLGVFDTKTKAKREIPISPELKEVLKRRLEDPGPDNRVFWDRNRKGEKQTFYKSRVTGKFKAVCKKAGIPYGDKLVDKKGNRLGVVMHSFRHTRTTKWIELGLSDEIIRRATGHKSLESYQQYANPQLPALMKLVTDGKSVQPIRTKTERETVNAQE